MIKICLILLLFSMVIGSCANSSAKDQDNIEKQQYTTETNPVEIMVLQKTDFNNELISNGKLKAYQKCELKFEVSGQVKNIFAKNGNISLAGSTIAVLDQEKANQSLKHAEIQFKKAKLDRFELLIGQGYNTDNIDSIPTKIIETANIRSGYSLAENNLEEAKINLNAHRLTAPFTGKIANLKTKVYEYTSANDAFCTIIDDSKFEVEFSVLETELKELKPGQKVKILPFSIEQSYFGNINEINPLIEENGMVKIKALVNNTGGLIEGMNVKIIIEKTIPGQLVVPKSAVLLRQNKEVLFTYKSGKAFWTYVHTTHENSSTYTVMANTDRGAELNAGDTIIISGNLNLAHESSVEALSMQ